MPAVLGNRVPMEGFIGFRAAVPYLPNGDTLIQLMLKLFVLLLYNSNLVTNMNFNVNIYSFQ